MKTWMRYLNLNVAVLAVALLALSGFKPEAPPVDGPEKDIVDVAVENQFNTLVAAVKAAGLVETLKSEGPFTVFAPTDEAFAQLPEGTLETLLEPENRDQLVAILTYHVVPGEVNASEVVKLESAATVQGASVQISTDGYGVKINDARVIKADIDTSNGVVHVIDTVLLPPSDH